MQERNEISVESLVIERGADVEIKPAASVTVQEIEATGERVDPEDYPKLKEGQSVVIEGFEFTIVRFNASSIVLKPEPTKAYPQSARRLMYHLRAGLGPYAPRE